MLLLLSMIAVRDVAIRSAGPVAHGNESSLLK